MVMRADVWGRALDDVLSLPLPTDRPRPRRVLAVPTPAGSPFTQRTAEQLVNADQIVVACGRYEGIDTRIIDHYSTTDVEILEFSLGDYVLNGGEVAALVLVEAVGRLLDGVVGNPESLVEESHSSDGLLEYPSYTHPREWRGHSIPEVLLRGNHSLITRWRRDRALERTAQRRPDLLRELTPDQLDRHDRERLAAQGWLVGSKFNSVTYRDATEADLDSLAQLAAATFPDACPPHVTAEHIAQFVGEHLSVESFRSYLADPEILLNVAETVEGGQEPQLVAYTLTERHAPEMGEGVPCGSAYLSKCYTASELRGSGVTGALLLHTVAEIQRLWDSPAVVLATNIGNKRALKFYRQHGFRKVGRRTFDVGGLANLDEVLVLNLTDKK